MKVEILQMSVDKIGTKIANFINNSERTQKVLKGIGKNPAVFSAVTAFGLASIVKPAITEVLPFKNEKDKSCSQATSIASGLTELAATAAIFIPLNKSIDKASKVLEKSSGTFFSNNIKGTEHFKSLTNRGTRLLVLIPLNIARTKLIKPILKKVFEKKEENKKRKLDKWA